MIVTISILASANLGLSLRPAGASAAGRDRAIPAADPDHGNFLFFDDFAGAAAAEESERNAGSALKNGDKVITNGGIYGTIVGLEGDTVQLRIAEQVKMKVARSAIAGMQAEPPKES